MGFTNYIAGLTSGLEVPNPAGDYAPHHVPVTNRDDQTGLDVHRAITKYEAEIAAGIIQFHDGPFASEYPGEYEQDNSLAKWIHDAGYDELRDQEFPTG
jgi:hypothetical protein